MTRLEIKGLKERKPRSRWRLILVIIGALGVAFFAIIFGQDLNESQTEHLSDRKGRESTKRSGKNAVHTPKSLFPDWSPEKGSAIKTNSRSIRPSPYSAGIWKQVTAAEESLISFRRELHANPEPAYKETKTSKKMAERFRKLGLEVKEGLAVTGLTALLKGAKPGPTVAVLAAMDGVPIKEKNQIPYASKKKLKIGNKEVWMSHAAGRDVELSVAYGVAEMLSKNRAVMPGAVKFIIQPASEGPTKREERGAPAMIAHGVLEQPNVETLFSIVVQPKLQIGLVGLPEARWWEGMTHFRISITGSGLDNCLRPQSAGCIDPILTASQLVVSLQTQLPRHVESKEGIRLTVGSIKGGSEHGRLPQSVSVNGTIRWKRRSDANSAIAFVRRTVKGIQVTSRADMRVTLNEEKGVAQSNPELIRWIIPTARRVLGPRGIIFGGPAPIADHFAAFRRRIPSALIQLGTHSSKLGKRRRLRTPNFNVDEECISVGVHFLSNVVLDYLLEHKGPEKPEENPEGSTKKNPDN